MTDGRLLEVTMPKCLDATFVLFVKRAAESLVVVVGSSSPSSSDKSFKLSRRRRTNRAKFASFKLPRRRRTNRVSKCVSVVLVPRNALGKFKTQKTAWPRFERTSCGGGFPADGQSPGEFVSVLHGGARGGARRKRWRHARCCMAM